MRDALRYLSRRQSIVGVDEGLETGWQIHPTQLIVSRYAVPLARISVVSAIGVNPLERKVEIAATLTPALFFGGMNAQSVAASVVCGSPNKTHLSRSNHAKDGRNPLRTSPENAYEKTAE